MCEAHICLRSAFCCLPSELELNFNLYTGGELKISQSLNSFVGRSDNINEPFVRSRLKLLTAVLILMNSTENGNDFLLGRERDGSRNPCTCTLSGFHFFLSGLVYKRMGVTFDTNTDFFFHCQCEIRLLK